MSLATRCTACGTVFRVVQDQLKVSEGWVRCGRCDEVFNALEGLFDLEREPSPAEPLAAAAAAPRPALAAKPASTLAPPSDDLDEDDVWPVAVPADRWEPSLADRLDAELLSTRPSDPDPPGLSSAPRRADHLEFSSARWDAELLTEEAALRADPGFAAEPAEDPSHGAPEFLRHADRRARWQRPRVRMLLGVAAMLLFAGLALQTVHHFRDTVAVRWPSTRGALLAWCAAMQCTLEAPRRIEDISVESTTLARASAASEAFRLSVSLRNHGALPLSVPSVDLKLTDGSGALIARRMLSPRDFGATMAALQPGSETTLQMLLSTGSRAVAGYTVEVFYP